jgi:hypothetical protein
LDNASIGFKKSNVETPESKKCPRCGETKPSGEFYRCVTRGDGLGGVCKVCANAGVQRANAAHLETYLAGARRRQKAYRQRPHSAAYLAGVKRRNAAYRERHRHV